MPSEEWDAIHGFVTPGEFRRFRAWIDEAIADETLCEVPVAAPYSRSSMLDERWFERSDGTVWRLVGPDPPFTGFFEHVT